MTTHHIDQLREWWETAEVGDPKDGDVIIEWAGDGHAVRTFLEAERDDLYAACTYRILARAPKPKPAWHDAVAVMARCSNAPEGHREPFIRSEATPDVWIGEGGYGCTDDLRDVTPLIEAKVTDEARDRVWDELVHHGLIDPQKHRPSQGWAADVVHATLGLETA